MTVQLTEGALAIIMQGGDYTYPVVQVLGVKQINDKYRVYLSDGKYSVSLAVTTASVYNKAGQKGLPKYSILRIIRFKRDVITIEGKDRDVLLILDLQVLKYGDEVEQKIGNPIPYTSLTSSDAPQDETLRSNKIPSFSSSSDGSESAPKKSKVMNLPFGGIDNGNKSLSGRIWRPISSLNIYQKKWTIRAKVLKKSPLRSWSNANGSGILFNFVLFDESGGIICTAFKENVIQYYDMIKVDMVYWISNCNMIMAQKIYSIHDYELTIGYDTVIEKCHDDDIAKLQIQYKFVDISKVWNLDANQRVDIIGVATKTEDIQMIQIRSNGKERKKRDIQLLDQSNAMVTLTLWGADAEDFDGTRNPVIALKGAVVSEFGEGKSLKIVSGTIMRIDPDIDESDQLKQWYKVKGVHVKADDISSGRKSYFNAPWKCFKEVSDQQMESTISEKGDYYQVKGTIVFVKTENCIYKACPSDKCNKKVIDNNDGTYRCERCNKSFPNFDYKLLGNMHIGDWSGDQWVTMFSDEAEKVVGMTAKEAGELLDTNPNEFNEKMTEAHFTEFILKCRVKMEIYNDEQRLQTVAVRVDPINYEEYNTETINNIKRLTNMG